MKKKVKNEDTFEGLIKENKANAKEYDELFKKIDSIWRKKVCYSVDVRKCGDMCITPDFTPTTEYNRLLKALDKIQAKSRGIQRRLNVVLGYTPKVEDDWEEQIRRENIDIGIKEEEKKAKNILNSLDFSVDRDEEEMYNDRIN